MSDSTLLSTWKNAEIEITANNGISVKGTFNFYIKSGTYYFTWDSDENSSILTDLKSFFILLHQIYSIQIKPITISKTGLIFVFKDLTVFPILILSSMTCSHLISYLLSKNLVKMDNNEIICIAQGKIQPSLNEKYVHSSRFLSLIQHIQNLIRLLGDDFITTPQNESIENKETHITKQDIDQKYIEKDGKIKNFNELIHLIQTKQKKLDDYSRAFIWPYLLNYYPQDATFQDKEEINNKNLILFNRLKEIRASFTKKQNEIFDATTNQIQENLGKIHMNDKNEIYIKQMIKETLVCYSILCSDIGYHESMENILFTFCSAFIDKIEEKEGKITTNDEKTFERDSFCAFLLSCLKNYLSIGCRFKLMERDLDSRKFYAERVNKILEVTHVQLHDWLTLYGLSDVDFLFRNSANGFSSIFKGDKILELWDYSLSSEYNSSFYIFFSAAITILSFDKLFMQTTLQFDENFQIEFNRIASEVDISKCITLTRNIIKILKARGPDTAWTFIPLKQNKDLIDFVPKYIKIVKD